MFFQLVPNSFNLITLTFILQRTHSIESSNFLCGKRHRTNNIVEGWHRRLSCIASMKNTNIFYLVKILKEVSTVFFSIQRVDLGLPTNKRKKKTIINVDKNIANALTQYRNDHDLSKCIKRLSYVTKF